MSETGSAWGVAIGGGVIGAVLTAMALVTAGPSLIGERMVRQAMLAHPDILVEAGLLFATEMLKPGGAYVAKVLAGGADHALVAELKRHFTTVKHAKPPASRKESSEWYVIAQGFKGRGREDGAAVNPSSAHP